MKVKKRQKKKYNKDHKKQFLNNKLEQLKSSIKTFTNNIPLHTDILNKEKINTKTFYDMNIYNYTSKDNNNYSYDLEVQEIPKKIYKCNKIRLLPSKEQSDLLINMMKGYRLVYNLVVRFNNTRNYLLKKYNKEKRYQEIINTQKINEEKELNKKIKLTKDQKEEIKRLKTIETEQRKLEREKIKLENQLKKQNDKKENEERLKNMTKDQIIQEYKKMRTDKITKLKETDNFNIILDYKILRTYFLKDEIEKISKIYKTPIHTLNSAVSSACSAFSSALTNQKRGNIKTFRIRQIKANKPLIIMDIEQGAFTKDGKSFIKSILGNKVPNKNNYDYTNIKNDCKIQYNKNTKKFILLVPEKIEIEENNNHDYISIDPGLRTFLNCTTNDKYIEIGNNLRDKIKKQLERYDSIKKWKKTKLRKRYSKIILEKIKNQINDTHWKIIDYLTKTYKTILIGNLSTKSIISNKNSILSNMDKRVVQTLSFYKFTQKLKYKCLIRNVNVKIVDEHYTSKVCTNCGNLKSDLKGDCEYKCQLCNTNIKRDYNGSRNIFIKSIKSINNN